jgi:hypothetical protein
MRKGTTAEHGVMHNFRFEPVSGDNWVALFAHPAPKGEAESTDGVEPPMHVEADMHTKPAKAAHVDGVQPSVQPSEVDKLARLIESIPTLREQDQPQAARWAIDHLRQITAGVQEVPRG